MAGENFLRFFKKRKNLTLTLISVFSFLICAGIFFFFMSRGSGIDKEKILASYFKGKKVEIDFSIFEEEEFKNLEVFEGSSLPEEKGRENPFSVYEE